jgi:arsenate reductase
MKLLPIVAALTTAPLLAAPAHAEAPRETRTHDKADRAMHPELVSFLAQRATEFDQIPSARKAELERLGDYARRKVASAEPLSMIFVCTHNSRRSHMSQLWAAASARLNGIHLESYSGGTEDTAFNPRAVAAMRRAGWHIEQTTTSSNPIYHASLAAGVPAYTCFSKAYDNPPNPKDAFAAVMVCSDADESCPAVFGEDFHIALPFNDPKVSDNTPEEAATYDERCAQIAREMLYAFTHAARS